MYPDPAPLLQADLTVSFQDRPVLRGTRLHIGHGACVGLVGQSGSGKSTLGLALMGLLGGEARVEGSVLFDGRELLGLGEREWRSIRGRRIALVLQGAYSALNPALRIESHLRESWLAHSKVRWHDARHQALALLRSFDLPCSDDFLARFPSQISIGQAQRVLIAMALLHRPSLLIADEVTSALDLLTQQEVLASLRRANREWGTAVLHITHDLLSVPALCGEVVVLDHGQIVESGPCAGVLGSPQHPYTQRLIGALPEFDWTGPAPAR
ncbi:MAG: ABC transporter ATP-binding protein [Candidatus Solibacter usitatus]|nr:ABC transporter ATP-binding protein [Candidatus Solibacter usitatus]